MTTKLHISPDLALPVDAATQTFAFIARKGAGKTYAAGKFVECLLDAHVQVIILDTVGNWYGLRLLADGKSAGYDIAVLGGLRGDIPLEAASGPLIADIAIESGRSLIIDISQFSLADRKRFAYGFGERLWLAKKRERRPTPVHLVIEESQLIVPQFTGKGEGDTAKMLGVYEEIIRLGRNYGIGVSMISQRPQSVNKEVLNQTECLFVGQVNGHQERDALKKWITHQGMDSNLTNELPSLAIGTFYIWSPQWLKILEKVRVGTKKTFDASATPKVGASQIRRELKPLDLDDLQTRMQAIIEKAEAANPIHWKRKYDESQKHLKRALADLEREKLKQPVAPAPKTVRVEVLKDGHVERLEKVARQILETVAKVKPSNGRPAPVVAATPAPSLRARQTEGYQPPTDVRRLTRELDADNDDTPADNSALKPGEKKVLAALIQFPGGLERGQLTALVGYKPTTRNEYIKILVRKGFAELKGSKVHATDAGREALPNAEPLPTGPDLQAYWKEKLVPGEWKILELLIAAYPNSVDRETLGNEAGYKATTRNEYIKHLKAKELVTVTKEGVTASENLF